MSDANFPRSMPHKACSPDNAACEGFFGRLKNELFYPQDWKNATIEQFVETLDSDICWYNEKRIKISLGSPSPVEYRGSLGLAASNQSKCLSASPPGQDSMEINTLWSSVVRCHVM